MCARLVPELEQAGVLVAFTVAAAPRADAAADKLLAKGIVRELALVFAAVGDAPAMDALRRGMLLVAAASSGVATFATAVRGWRSALERAAFQRGGAAHAHGAVWPLWLPARTIFPPASCCQRRTGGPPLRPQSLNSPQTR